jgi:hypothetical protein
MDISQNLADLRQQVARVNAAILALEDIMGLGGSRPRKSNRGRKSMGHDERVAVSERMKRYWDARRFGTLQATAAEATGCQSTTA